MMRDFRINRIFEGSSEIMRLFIAREAVDTHLQVAGDLINPKASAPVRRQRHGQGGRLLRGLAPQAVRRLGPLAARTASSARSPSTCATSSAPRRKLARSMFYAMGRYQAKLERKQALLGRFVDIGAELYAMWRRRPCVRAQVAALSCPRPIIRAAARRDVSITSSRMKSRSSSIGTSLQCVSAV
jgi:hypothetical protein